MMTFVDITYCAQPVCTVNRVIHPFQGHRAMLLFEHEFLCRETVDVAWNALQNLMP